MNINFCLACFISICLGLVFQANSQTIRIEQSNKNGIYKKGEKIEVFVELSELEADSISVKIDENYDENSNWQKIKYPGKKLILFEGSYKKPTSLIVEVRAGEMYAGTGLVVEPDKIKPALKRPKDFDRFWKNEKITLRSLAMRIEMNPVELEDTSYFCTNVEINCTGPKPVRGYFAKPKNAKLKSLPIVLNVHAAGVKGSWCLAKPEIAIKNAKKGNGAISFDLNAHGMLNGQPQEYYNNLEAGELRNYWEIGIENRDDYYFRGMYLRLLRALDFLCAQPEWDGKRIIVIGESQGGGQALVAAGLDSRVGAVVATVPAMCDFGRTLIGEKGGWPNPFKMQKSKEKLKTTVPYFDVAHMLKNSKATLVTEIGLIDYTCPSLGIYAAINQAKGKKITLPVSYRGHHQNQPNYNIHWEEHIYKSKTEFISEYLK